MEYRILDWILYWKNKSTLKDLVVKFFKNWNMDDRQVYHFKMTIVLYLCKRICYSKEIYTEVFRDKGIWCMHLNLKSFRKINMWI